MDDVPALVNVHVWGVSAGSVPGLMLRLPRHRARLAGTPGVRFSRLLGTATGGSMRARDADLGHWAMLVCWESAAAAEQFHHSPLRRRWMQKSYERLDLTLRPLACRGRWGGREPFGRPRAARHDGPVAALTRARLRPGAVTTFGRAAGPVARDASGRDGLLLALGIGELPVGLQGTLSLWRNPDDLAAFAYRGAAHREVVRRSGTERWYAEELFARFAVSEVSGRYRGRGVTGVSSSA